ncbi:MAG: hypothetical protein V1750_01755 [Acidobacteriota bacterium]
MTPFRLRKWYLDGLNADGAFVLAFLAEVRFVGLAHRVLNLEVVPPGGVAAARLSIPLRRLEATPDGGASFDGGGLRLGPAGGLTVERDDLRVDLKLTHPAPARDEELPVLEVAHGRRRLLWMPRVPTAELCGTVALPGQLFEVASCQGYADFVESTILPPITPVDLLLWGRAHDPEAAATFALLVRARRPLRGLVVVEHRGRLEAFGTPALSVHELAPAPVGGGMCPRRYEISATRPDARVQVSVEHGRPLSVADFVADSMPSHPRAAAALSLLARRPRGAKHLAVAVVRLETAAGTILTGAIPCIAEAVRFGRRA